MTQEPPSQFRVILLLGASFLAGTVVSTSLSQRQVAHQIRTIQPGAPSQIAESP
jgi:hypothetical protein